MEGGEEERDNRGKERKRITGKHERKEKWESKISKKKRRMKSVCKDNGR